MFISGVLLVGCVAQSADDLYRRKQEEAKKRLPAPPTIEETKPITPPSEVQRLPTPTIEPKVTVSGDEPPAQLDTPSSSDDVDRQSIQRGKTLYHGKAVCFGCHGQNGDISSVSNPKVRRLDPSPADLRKPTDKSVRQLYLIIRYGIPGTAMVQVQDLAKLSNEEVLNIISYFLDLQGNPLPFETISDQRFNRHTETDKAIADLCEKEAIGDSDMREHCEDRYAKRYRDLIIGRPPHIPTARYTEIERHCKQQAAKDLDKLALCYRAEY
jgi:mono/diheme cytochrome c family protein